MRYELTLEDWLPSTKKGLVIGHTAALAVLGVFLVLGHSAHLGPWTTLASYGGVPMVAIVYVLLTGLQAFNGWYAFKRTTPEHRSVEVSFSANGIKVTSALTTMETPWSGVAGFRDDSPRWFFIFLATSGAHALPLRVLDPTQLAAVRTWLANQSIQRRGSKPMPPIARTLGIVVLLALMLFAMIKMQQQGRH